MLKDSERLNSEIHAAIHSMLGANIEDLLWTSVGLLESTGDIKWDSCVNDEYDGKVVIYCPTPELEPLPCKPASTAISEKCTVKSGDGRSYVAPPCLKDNIDVFCAFRKQLSGEHGLEKQTVKKGSLSLSVLSKEYFISKGAHPYITIKDGGFSKHPWIMTNKTVLADLPTTSEPTMEEKAEAEGYKELAKKCMPEGTTAVLIPLIQAHGERKNVYIGAIVICAKAEHKKEGGSKRVTYTDIWEHLPRIKATALSLAEVYKHLYGITDNIQKNSISTFLDFLIRYDCANSLFQGNCSATQCDIHNGIKSRHRKDCRLINSGDKMKTLFTDKNFELQKSLFATKAITEALPVLVDQEVANKVVEKYTKVGSSYPVPVNQVIKFLSHPDFGISCKSIGVDFNFAWPTSPGLFSFISFLDIYNDLNNYSPSAENGAENGVKIVTIEYSKVENKDVVAFFIVFQLATSVGAKDLAAKWSGIREGGRRTTNAIKSGMKGIFDKKVYAYDLDRGCLPKTLSEKLMAPTDVPIFYPVFYEDKLRLTWIANTSDTVINDTSNLQTGVK